MDASKAKRTREGMRGSFAIDHCTLRSVPPNNLRARWIDDGRQRRSDDDQRRWLDDCRKRGVDNSRQRWVDDCWQRWVDHSW